MNSLLLSVIIIIFLAINRVTAIPLVNKQLTRRHIGSRICSTTKQSQLSGGKENDEQKYELKYQSQHPANIQKELLLCLSSFNPFDRAKIERLREEVRIAENEEKRKQMERIRIAENEEKEKIRKAAEDREREQKVINYSILIDDDFYTSSNRLSLTRTIFEKWVADNKVLHSEDGSTVCTFEELVEGNSYVLEQKMLRNNF